MGAFVIAVVGLTLLAMATIGRANRLVCQGQGDVIRPSLTALTQRYTGRISCSNGTVEIWRDGHYVRAIP
jgi:hypothetical protein